MGTGTTQDRTDNSRCAGDPPLGREQGSEGDGFLATGRRPGHRAEIRDKVGGTVHGADRPSDQDGPEPGHLIEEARSEQPGGRCERSDGERTGPECRRGTR